MSSCNTHYATRVQCLEPPCNQRFARAFGLGDGLREETHWGGGCTRERTWRKGLSPNRRKGASVGKQISSCIGIGLKPLSLPRALARLSCISTCWHDCCALSNSSIQRHYCRALALLQGIIVIAGHDRGASSKAITKTDSESHTLSVTVHHIRLPSLCLCLPLSLTRFLALP